MPLISLPQNTPLQAKGPLNLAWDNGAVVFNSPVTFPTVGVKLKDIEGMAKLAADNEDPVIPVLVTPQGLQTDLNWWTLVKVRASVMGFQGDRQKAWDLERTMELVAKGQVSWDLRCPCLEGTQSLMGFFMTVHGFHAGAKEHANAAMQEPSLVVKNHPTKKLLKHAHVEELLAFRDGTNTLLDLAFANFQWETAAWLWKKGVRWSPEAIAAGKSLEDLAAASLKLRSSYSCFLNPNWNQATPQQRTQESLNWLEPWLARWEALEVSLPTGAQLTRRAQHAQASGWTVATELRDTPQTFWAARMAEQTGPNIQKLDKLPEHTLAVVDRWLLFWTQQGVDFETLMLPSSNTSERPFRECWEKAPDWLSHVRLFQRQARLDECLPKPGGTGHKPRF